MMNEIIYEGVERRKFPRANCRFVVLYKVLGDKLTSNRDVSQTKNISCEGLLITTSKAFPPLTTLEIKLRLPIFNNLINLLGEIVESTEILEDLIYDTRLHLIQIGEDEKNLLSKTVELLLNKTLK